MNASRLRLLASKVIRRGPSRVLLTVNPGPRFGNFLYYWLHAAIVQSTGTNYRVQTHDHLDPWLAKLDDVRRDLSINAKEIGTFDRREWAPPGQFQNYGEDFDRSHIESFVKRYLLGSRLLSDLPELDYDTVVVNVRRGDYYSVPKFRDLYGYDIERYVGLAMDRVRVERPVERVVVVSDDVAWCRENLDQILSRRGTPVSYGEKFGPIDDFRRLASAKRLIGTNSTFSYWGAYVASTRSSSAVHVVMPRFMSSKRIGGAVQLLPSWDVIEEVR